MHPPLRTSAAVATLFLAGCTSLGSLGVLGGAPSEAEISSALKQALARGTTLAVSQLAREGGYLNDPLVHIPFPQQAAFVEKALRTLGLGTLVERFEARLNAGAEAGAQQALPIFAQAIQEMSIADATGILFGGEHAATEYFRSKTYDSLVSEFRPAIERSLDEVGALGAWSEIATRYNQIPLTSNKVDTDIAHYATARALDGLFTRVAAQEAEIRSDPVARTTELLRRVFGHASREQAGP